ncbi:MAG TPA: HGxxPAAW family protein [Trebonia sp.]|nr:HGxxPAAW family protein [Trebonia sp.]
MAEQATGTVEGTGTAGALAQGSSHMEHNSGRPIAWVGTITVFIGFVIGGVAFPIANPGPNWVLFWIGTGIAVVGCLILLFSKAMSTDWY